MRETSRYLHDVYKTRFINVNSNENKFEKTIIRYLSAWKGQVISKLNKHKEKVKKQIG